MKNPNPHQGAGAFPVTSTATLASPVDDTWGLGRATPSGPRFRWCNASNSIQPIKIRKGCITHV